MAGEPFDLRHYEAIGTMAQALSLHAEEAWQELGDPRLQAICETLFQAITEKDSDGHDIRRPLRLGEVSRLAEASEEEVCQVVEVFRHPGRSFLTPAAPAALHADRVLDLSHESLIRIWDRLLDWVGAEARGAQTYRELARDSARYHKGEGGLYRDPELQLALNWRHGAQPNEAWARRYDPAFERAMVFLDYSEKDRQERIARRERLRRRQIRSLQLGIGILRSPAWWRFITSWPHPLPGPRPKKPATWRERSTGKRSRRSSRRSPRAAAPRSSPSARRS